MSADGDIILLEKRNVLIVSLKAIQKTGRGNYVEVLKVILPLPLQLQLNKGSLK
ncbi:MAG: hypothetical protein NZ841_05365 [Dictyoglomus sp.]|nr:hypothetical protein [Dictyoglomus sp.]MCX7942033.1 hypothetical protein [Dictyoglomaceae bacterium]MDW8188706.1 hypothetical protein [Dictyoglomus sp.]